MQDVAKVVTLHRNESVLITLRQSYLSSISPDTIVLTDKRIIIIHNSFWGLYAGVNIVQPTRVISVNLGSVAGSTSTDGKILASVHVRIRGSAEEENAPRTGLHIDGLRIDGAQKLTSILDDLVSGKPAEVKEIALKAAVALLREGGSRLVWLGIETPDYVAYLLGVGTSSVMRVRPADISAMSADGLKVFEGAILACYTGNLSAEIAYMLKNEYGINTVVLKGGVSGTISTGRNGKDNKSRVEK